MIARVQMTLLCGGLFLSASARADAEPQRVAVLPVSLLAAPAATGERVRARLGQTLQSESDVEVVPAALTDRAVDAHCGSAPRWDCLEQEHKLLAIGRALEARVVVAGNLAVMGDTRVLKLRVVDLSSETVSGEVVEMTGANDEAALGCGDATAVLVRFAPDPAISGSAALAPRLATLQLLLDADQGFTGLDDEAAPAGLRALDADGDGQGELLLELNVSGRDALPVVRVDAGRNTGIRIALQARGLDGAGEVVALGGLPARAPTASPSAAPATGGSTSACPRPARIAAPTSSWPAPRRAACRAWAPAARTAA